MVAKRENPNFATKFLIVVNMTDYEYILNQAKKFYYTKWDDGKLRKCVDMLHALEHDELVALYHCKWIKKVMHEAIFNILYMDRIGEREENIKEMSTNELINEFEDRSSGNISLIREELRRRYKEDFGDDRIKIAAGFKNAQSIRRILNGWRFNMGCNGELP